MCVPISPPASKHAVCVSTEHVGGVNQLLVVPSAREVKKCSIDFGWVQKKQPRSLRPADAYKESEKSELLS